MQDRLARDVPYVHCFNHKLHLVIVDSISTVAILSQYFDQCRSLYNFLRRPKVSEQYSGTHLHRLMEHRWSGHLNTTQSILKNFSEIIKVLECLSSDSSLCGGDIITEATGLLCVVKTVKFCFSALLAQTLLKCIEPADRELQSRQCDRRALHLIDIVDSEIEGKRTEELFKSCLEKAKGNNLQNLPR